MSTPSELDFAITPQPTETTCGPACLHAVYRYFGLELPLEQLVDSVASVPGGGTFSVMLALDAIRRGYRATIYTSDVQLFDPSWFSAKVDLVERLLAQAQVKADPKLIQATEAYVEFLSAGGRLVLRDIDLPLLTAQFRLGLPVIAGLNATWLYQAVRDDPATHRDNDLGVATGHFVVLHGAYPDSGQVAVADPYLHLPKPGSHSYREAAQRVLNAIMLGIMTYDAKLLVVSPPGRTVPQ